MTGSNKNLLKTALEKANPASYARHARKGLSETVVKYISKEKGEPAWMLNHRLKSLKTFFQKPMLQWGPDLSGLNFNKIIFYAKASPVANVRSWKNVPKDIKETFERLGIPKAEKKYLAGAGAQYESENIYHKLKEKWRSMGVIFEDMGAAVRLYPNLVKKYFMKCVSMRDHKFAALHGAVWSGGTFIYIPKKVTVAEPLQAYFRMNAPSMGQFEHTLIIVEKGASASYIEGCSAPKYFSPSLHAGMVEIFVNEGARLRYSSVENWSKNTYNLNTKRAIIGKNAVMEWVSGNFGAGCTMLYPCSVLKGENARADHLGVAFAGSGQVQDTGAKVIHEAPNTSSKIIMKSIAKNGGKIISRNSVKILKNAKAAKTHVRCDSILLDNRSAAKTFPALDIKENDVSACHEATVGKISEDTLFYCASRGIPEDKAVALIVNGFIEPIVKELPLEYAVELNRIIELETE